jgi:hypothetical protein
METSVSSDPVEKRESVVSVQIREATVDDLDSILEMGSTVCAGMRFFVAESGGKVVACLGEKPGNPGQRWLMDWHSDGSKLGSLAMLRLERDFEKRAQQDEGVNMILGISEPQPTPNLQAAVDRGWSVLGVLLGKAV